uniref:Receptor ligand binding region domain-containing protein n=1 Tax=Timema shepardi TaxID=629360 RepID=A0A7R9FY19_TIMSH|nr:unnamed protein product [Timema shepardi]
MLNILVVSESLPVQSSVTTGRHVEYLLVSESLPVQSPDTTSRHFEYLVVSEILPFQPPATTGRHVEYLLVSKSLPVQSPDITSRHRASQSSLQLQLAPSLEHQTAAMLSILERYKWHQFSVVTSQIAGQRRLHTSGQGSGPRND